MKKISVIPLEKIMTLGDNVIKDREKKMNKKMKLSKKEVTNQAKKLLGLLKRTNTKLTYTAAAEWSATKDFNDDDENAIYTEAKKIEFEKKQKGERK